MFFSYSEDSLKKSKNFFISCIEDRINELSTEYNQSVQYSDFYKQYNEVLKKLEQILSQESFALILLLDGLYEKLSVDYQNFFYEQGFLDCRILLDFLKR